MLGSLSIELEEPQGYDLFFRALHLKLVRRLWCCRPESQTVGMLVVPHLYPGHVLMVSSPAAPTAVYHTAHKMVRNTT